MTTIDKVKNIYDAMNLIINYCVDCVFFDEDKSICVLKCINKDPNSYNLGFKGKITFEEIKNEIKSITG